MDTQVGALNATEVSGRVGGRWLGGGRASGSPRPRHQGSMGTEIRLTIGDTSTIHQRYISDGLGISDPIGLRPHILAAHGGAMGRAAIGP